MDGFAPILTSVEAHGLLAAVEAGDAVASVSLDLGLSHVELGLADGIVRIDGTELSATLLRRIAREQNKCFEVQQGTLRPITVHSAHTGWVRSLSPTGEAPTTLVAGFAMHRVVGTTPMKDTRAKVRALGRPRGHALDTATGLGYTAIELARTCTEVVSVELDPAAIELARRNPWSASLFCDPVIELLQGDVAEAIHSFEDGAFAVALHDPPTLQLAGELYSRRFYGELRRVLRTGGRLFHYVGDPAGGAGARATRGVVKRLAEAGFVDVRADRRAFGVIARAGYRRRRGRS